MTFEELYLIRQLISEMRESFDSLESWMENIDARIANLERSYVIKID